MADFEPAHALTVGHEIGYGADPDDAGGETYNGIARRYQKDWFGWTIIDNLKNEPNFPDILETPHIAGQLNVEVKTFYYNEKWSAINGDNIPDQNLANLVYDVAVNGGIRRAGKFLQRALNLLNRQGKDYPDLEPDGDIGPKTLEALKKYLLKGRDINGLMLFFSAQMITHWMDRMERLPKQEKYGNGIANRWAENAKNIADSYYLT